MTENEWEWVGARAFWSSGGFQWYWMIATSAWLYFPAQKPISIFYTQSI